MNEQIQRAESAIKAGDTKTAFEILRQLLAENPDSERAWWVMSGLVPREQRAHCLQQVLRINPQNQFARNALRELHASEYQESPPDTPTPQPAEPEESQPAAPVPQSPESESAPPAPSQGEDYQAWYYADRSEVHLTILAKQGVIQATIEPGLLTRVQAAVKKGKLPDPLVKEKTPIPYSRLIRVRQIMSSLRVFFQRGKSEDSIRLELADSEAADQVLNALRIKLGPDFTLKSAPMKLSSSLIISAVLVLLSGGLTAFFMWGAFEVQSGRASATGSIRTRTIINLVSTLGPVGVGIIGGILILLSLGISAWLLFKPPTVTELTRRA